MSAGDTLRELFVHNDWGRDELMALNMLRHLGAKVPALDHVDYLYRDSGP